MTTHTVPKGHGQGQTPDVSRQATVLAGHGRGQTLGMSRGGMR
jgi:hypothetical protein